MANSTILVNTSWGSPLVTDEPALASVSHEGINLAYLDEKLPGAGSVFVDVGAHHGLFTSFLATKAGPAGLVYAFEPYPNNLRYLLYNTTFRPSRAPVIVCPLCLGSKSQTAALQCWWPDRPLASAIPCLLPSADEADYHVPTAIRPLDSLGLPRVDFIKMDVQHWEYEVVVGARQLILRDRPFLFIELHSKEVEVKLVEWCSEHDLPYRIRRDPPSTTQGSDYLIINEPP